MGSGQSGGKFFGDKNSLEETQNTSNLWPTTDLEGIFLALLNLKGWCMMIQVKFVQHFQNTYLRGRFGEDLTWVVYFKDEFQKRAGSLILNCH